MSQLSSGNLFLRRLQCLKGAEDLTAGTPTHRWACLPRISEEVGVLFPVQSCLPHTMVLGRDLGGVRSWRPNPVLQSYSSHSAQSRAGERTSLCILCCTELLFVYLMPWGWMRGWKSGYVACAASSPSPESEPQLGLALGARSPPSSPYPPGLPSTTPYLLPCFPQAPIHPQCNKIVCSVRLLPLLYGPAEGQSCWR